MEQRLPCLYCNRTFLNADTVIAHAARDHDPRLNTASAVWGSMCPACGRTFARLPFHSSRVHRRQISLLFAESRALDPYGAVQEQLRRYAALIQEQLVELLKPGTRP